MPKIVLVTTVEASKKVVHDILVTTDKPIIGVTIKRTFIHGDYMILGIATQGGKVFIIDIKEHEDLLIHGDIIRLLQATELTKVLHRSQQDVGDFYKKYGIRFRNVFDTQMAYGKLMMNHDLPQRSIQLYDLWQKFGNRGTAIDKHIKDFPRDTGLYWAERPLTSDVLLNCAVEAAALVPTIYENICKSMNPSMVKELTVNQQVTSHSPGKRAVSQRTPQHTDWPITKLSKCQVSLLEQTVVGARSDYV